MTWGIMGDTRGKGKQRNMNRGLTGMDNEGGLTVRVGVMEQGRAVGKRWDNCNQTNKQTNNK